MLSEVKRCRDCKTKLSGHGSPVRCHACATRHRYVLKYGHPPLRLIGKCAACRKEFNDYLSNKRKVAQNRFCSARCRATWTGISNSILRGGDGIKRSKAQKDAMYYRKTAPRIRKRMLQRYQENRAAILLRLRQKNRALKQEVISAYGGRCVCCNEQTLEFLTIDHLDGKGFLHRRKVGKGRHIYHDLKAQGFPKEGFRVLCLNCNISRGFYGYCPHNPTDRESQLKKVSICPGRKRSVV